jgi:hypothetical protein
VVRSIWLSEDIVYESKRIIWNLRTQEGKGAWERGFDCLSCVDVILGYGLEVQGSVDPRMPDPGGSADKLQ